MVSMKQRHKKRTGHDKNGHNRHHWQHVERYYERNPQVFHPAVHGLAAVPSLVMIAAAISEMPDKLSDKYCRSY